MADLTTTTRAIHIHDHNVFTDVINIFRKSEMTNEMDEDGVKAVFFEASLPIVRDRLEAMGFDMPSARKAFARGMNRLIRRSQQLVKLADSRAEKTVESERLRFYAAHIFDRWLSVLDELLNSEIERDSDYSEEARFFRHDDLKYTNNGFPVSEDFRYYIRAALQGCPEKDMVQYGLTHDIADFEWDPEDFIPDPVEDQIHRWPYRKLIIITEGSSDRTILNLTLQVLYPHLVEFWSFLDFDTARQGGGAAEAVRLLKGLAAAGVHNRVVAVFDNDTLAHEAIAPLARIKLPDNMRFLTLPHSKRAAIYPTIGPSGKVELLDVNASASSIEMFLGPKILTDSPPPVHWRGWNDSQKRYQGQIEDKNRLLAEFKTLAEACVADRSLIQEDDWADIRAVLDGIRFAFR